VIVPGVSSRVPGCRAKSDWKYIRASASPCFGFDSRAPSSLRMHSETDGGLFANDSRETGWSLTAASWVWIFEPASAVRSRPATNSKTPEFFSRAVLVAVLPFASRKNRWESDSVNEWLGAVSRSNHRWDERIYDVQVRVDGNLAQVWAPYTFYLDGKISHCGVDALQLLKDPSGWKVTQLADTRRRDNCRDVQP